MYTIIRSDDYEGPFDLFIKCHECGSISFNANDIQEKYCGRCHKFHSILDAGKEIKEA